MPVLRNARHERFAQELAKGNSQTEAYRLAGYSDDPGNAARLTRNDKVVTRVAELQGKSAAKAAMTTESLIGEADRLLEGAEAANQYSAAIAALTAKAKLGGLWIERQESKVEQIEHAVGRHPRAAEDWADAHSATSH